MTCKDLGLHRRSDAEGSLSDADMTEVVHESWPYRERWLTVYICVWKESLERRSSKNRLRGIHVRGIHVHGDENYQEDGRWIMKNRLSNFQAEEGQTELESEVGVEKLRMRKKQKERGMM